MNSQRILIVDDDAGIRRSLARLLEDEGFSCLQASDGEQCLAQIPAESPDLIFLDIKMPKSSGLDVLGQIKKLDPKVPVIIMTAHGTTSTAIQAIKLGAYDYILKPFDIPSLKDLIRKALEASAAMKNVVAVSALDASEEGGETIIGKSKAMQEVYKMIGKIAESDITVLLEGESGTGKELVARAIYHHSLRNQKPFLAVNCAAIPETLLESELFGHERGAFTDAKTMRIGKFEQCNTGTIFLDEIGDMSLSTQSKVLRVLQEKEFQRLGGRDNIKVNVRVLAATNRDLAKDIREGKFRQDLYYRLNVLTIKLPPLRERKEDIPPLAQYFLNKFRPVARRFSLAPAAMEKLRQYDWPGNVRQLENVIKRAMVVSKKDVLLPGDFQLVDDTVMLAGSSKEFCLEEIAKAVFSEMLRSSASGDVPCLLDGIEAKLIQLAMEHTQGNQLQAAKVLGMNRNTLRKKMQVYHIKGQYKASTPSP